MEENDLRDLESIFAQVEVYLDLISGTSSGLMKTDCLNVFISDDILRIKQLFKVLLNSQDGMLDGRDFIVHFAGERLG
ncbi:MAG: hypothetical protein JO125_15725 [Chloroflexi bacterium]|nr:hypothetical protein [Chloroflexota bacterium]